MLHALIILTHIILFFKLYFLVCDVDHFKVFIEFVTILLLFYVLTFWPQGL